MLEYSRREETACGLPIILGCKLLSGHERFQIPFDLHRKPQTEGSHLRNELKAQGRGQIHLCLLSSSLLIVLYLIPSFTYLQYTRGGDACVAPRPVPLAHGTFHHGRRKRPYGLDDSAPKDLLLKGLASALVSPKRNERGTILSRRLLA